MVLSGQENVSATKLSCSFNLHDATQTEVTGRPAGSAGPPSPPTGTSEAAGGE